MKKKIKEMQRNKMRTRYESINLNNIETYDIKDRESIVKKKANCKLLNRDSTMEEWLVSLPDILIGRDFKKFIYQTRQALKEKKSIILLMGAHLIKCGLSPLIIKLMKDNIISHLAINGASAIHDVEMALYGETSEDVQSGLENGSFGMCNTTADFINNGLKENSDNNLGYGESLAVKIGRTEKVDIESSLIYQAYINDIPLSVHSALGTEINHQHPSFNGSVYGEKSLNDFKIFTNSISKLREGSILINIGSTVIMPEVFLKALTIARNLKNDCFGFHTAVFDMIKHYRPLQNVALRPTKNSGSGYYFIGHFELMLPIFTALI
jgi:hypothetical protein